MRKAAIGVLTALVLLSQAIGFAQSTPMTGRKLTYFWREEPRPAKAALIFTAAEVQTVLKSPGGDHQVAIVDVGKFNLCIGARRAGRGGGSEPINAGMGRAPSPYPVLKCGATSGTLSGVSGLSHDEQTETYVIIAGSGTVVTGGVIVNGQQSTPEEEPTRVLNGPSCHGAIGGEGVEKRLVKVGDIVVIPPNTPHGWAGNSDDLDYLLIRQDPDRALPAGYIHPSIRASRAGQSGQ